MDSPNNLPTAFPEETLDLKRYFFLFLSNWYWIAISVFFGLFTAYLINRYSEQVYSVRATLIIGNAEGRRISTGMQNFMREMNIMQDRKRIENEIGILKSYTLSRTVIDELPSFKITYVSVGRRGIAETKMYNKAPFYVELDTAFQNTNNYPINLSIISKDQYILDFDDKSEIIKMNFGEKFTNDRFSFTINLKYPEQFEIARQSKNYYFIINADHTLAVSYMRKLNVELSDRQGSILTLSSTGFVAQQEADYINKLMEVYIKRELSDKSLTAENTISFIEEQLRGITDSLKRAEVMLQNFRIGNSILDLSMEARTLLERLERHYSDKNIISLHVEYFNYLEKYLVEKRDLNGLISDRKSVV